jgi:hypothetical protein
MAKQNDTEQNSTTFDKLLQPLEKFLEQHERDHPPHHREKLHFVCFVRLLVYYFIKGCESGRLFLTDIESARPELKLIEVARSTFFDAFSRFPVSWFAQMFSFVLVAVAWKSIPELDALGQLFCVDGSIFPAIATMLWAEYTSEHQAIRMHLVFELNRMIPAQFLVADGNSNEKKALVEMLEDSVTYIADRGYFAYYLLKAIADAGAFFVIRAKNNFTYERVRRLPVELPAAVEHIFLHVTDQRVRLPNAKGCPIYRLISFYVGKEQYSILTNRFDLTTFQIILLYAYRWQVELIFRFLKRSMNGLHLISHSREGVTIQFYALLIAALLELRLKQQCVDIYEAENGADASTSRGENTIAGLMVDPERLTGARGSTFLATIGEKLHRYWKISKHWLTTLRNYLARTFTPQIAMHLGRV